MIAQTRNFGRMVYAMLTGGAKEFTDTLITIDYVFFKQDASVGQDNDEWSILRYRGLLPDEALCGVK